MQHKELSKKSVKKSKRHTDRVLNFYAGPGALPLPVLERVHAELFNFNDTGMSVMELSHRSPEIEYIIDDSAKRIKRLLNIEDQFEVVFLQGGGSLQFLMVPMNFSRLGDPVDYIDTGYWSDRAIQAAKSLGRNLQVVASSSDYEHTAVPDLKQVQPRSEARYLHLCTNNTVVGTQFHDIPAMPVPVVADMSSDFMSKPITLDNLDLIYAHAQKNAGLAGVTAVLLRKELLDHIEEDNPELLDYRTHIQHKSNYHTPPCFSIYIMWHILRWIEEDIGGLENLGQVNQQKADLLYKFIDRSLLFYCPVRKPSRSQMNVVFTLPTEAMEQQFIQDAGQAGLIGVAGHRKRGGCRVSIYNGVTLEAVKSLIEFMKEFERKHFA